jgi:Salmonella virulence plasmid 65kDa B protein
VPIVTSPGRSGFGPQLSLAYDSGSGNGPFGFGWTLSLPSITRKTDKGLPQYDAEESDTFILSGAEDLVPALIRSGGRWMREVLGPRTMYGQSYLIHRYRPRVDGLFSRIERWINPADPADTFWRSITKNNLSTWYGRTSESRITDPDYASRIFSWSICESYDDRGNVALYKYKQENADNVDLTRASERNRTRSVRPYLKRILYGNRTPYFPDLGAPRRSRHRWTGASSSCSITATTTRAIRCRPTRASSGTAGAIPSRPTGRGSKCGRIACVGVR